MAALYHDAPEIITGDMPTPVKYHSPALRDAYKALETESVRSMAALLPAELAAELTPCMDGSALTAEEHRLLKAAAPARRNRWWFSGSLLPRKTAKQKNPGSRSSRESFGGDDQI